MALSGNNTPPPQPSNNQGTVNSPSGQVTYTSQGVGNLIAYVNIYGSVSYFSPSLGRERDPCKPPFAKAPTITVWQKPYKQNNWVPSTDPKDAIVATLWGAFGHDFQFIVNPYTGECEDRTVKLKIAYDANGKHLEAESDEIDCKTKPSLPPAVSIGGTDCKPDSDEEELIRHFRPKKGLLEER